MAEVFTYYLSLDFHKVLNNYMMPYLDELVLIILYSDGIPNHIDTNHFNSNYYWTHSGDSKCFYLNPFTRLYNGLHETKQYMFDVVYKRRGFYLYEGYK